MTDVKRRKLVSNAAAKIWADFEWLWEHTQTEYVSSEYPANKNYSIFAFEESDVSEDGTVDKWITITLEKYNDKGKCVNDFVVTFVTGQVSKRALIAGISHLLILLEQKFGTIDMLESDEVQPLNTHKDLTDKDLSRIEWLFKATDFSNAQIGRMFDISAVAVSKIRRERMFVNVGV